jgi:hypothetical protein
MSVSAQYPQALRALLMTILPRDADFVAFCIDSFPMTSRNFTNNMDTNSKLDLFIARQPDPSDILSALRRTLLTEHRESQEREVNRRVRLALDHLSGPTLRAQAVVWTLSRIATDDTDELFAALEVAARLLKNPRGMPQDLEHLERWLKNERSFIASSEIVDDHPSPHLEDWPILILAWRALYTACEHVDDDSVEMLASCLAVLLRRILPLGKKRSVIPKFPEEAMGAVECLRKRANKRGTAQHAILTNLVVRLCVHYDRLEKALPVLEEVPESPGLLYASTQIAESWILRMQGNEEKAKDLLAELLEKLRGSENEPLQLWMSAALSLLSEIGQIEQLERAYPLACRYAGSNGQVRFAFRLAEHYVKVKDHRRATTWMQNAEDAAQRAGHEMLIQQLKHLRCIAAFQNKEPFSAHRATLYALEKSFLNDTENLHALGKTLQLRGQWRLHDHGHNDPEHLLGIDDLQTAEFYLRKAGYLVEANGVLAGWSKRLVERSRQQLGNAQYAQALATLEQVLLSTQHIEQMRPVYEDAKAAAHFAKQGMLAQEYLVKLRAGSEEALLQVIKLAMLLVSPEDTPLLAPWLRLTLDIGDAIEIYANRDQDAPEYDLASQAIELKQPSDVRTKYKILEALRAIREAAIEASHQPPSGSPD